MRELYNVILQAAVMSEGSLLSRGDLKAVTGDFTWVGEPSADGRPLGDGFDVEEHLRSIQRRYLARAMEEAGGVKTRAARLLGYRNYQTLEAQLKRLEVRWQERKG